MTNSRRAGEASRPIEIKIGATPNQIVAANIRRIRKDRGWSQQRLAERLRQRGFPGWTVQMISDAESARRGASRKRERQFTVNELVAFSRALKATVFDLLVPDTGEVVQVGTTLNKSRADYTHRLFAVHWDDSVTWKQYREMFEETWKEQTAAWWDQRTTDSLQRTEAELRGLAGEEAVSEWKEALNSGPDGFRTAMGIYWQYRDQARGERDK